jgi:hypothetical protein
MNVYCRCPTPERQVGVTGEIMRWLDDSLGQLILIYGWVVGINNQIHASSMWGWVCIYGLVSTKGSHREWLSVVHETG